jgi:hypothetical protein
LFPRAGVVMHTRPKATSSKGFAWPSFGGHKFPKQYFDIEVIYMSALKGAPMLILARTFGYTNDSLLLPLRFGRCVDEQCDHPNLLLPASFAHSFETTKQD